MWCPALAAFSRLKVSGRKLSGLGWKWPKTRYALASWFIPLLYTTIGYLIIWLAVLWCRFDAASARVAIRSASVSANAPNMFKVRKYVRSEMSNYVSCSYKVNDKAGSDDICE